MWMMNKKKLRRRVKELFRRGCEEYESNVLLLNQSAQAVPFEAYQDFCEFKRLSKKLKMRKKECLRFLWKVKQAAPSMLESLIEIFREKKYQPNFFLFISTMKQFPLSKKVSKKLLRFKLKRLFK